MSAVSAPARPRNPFDGLTPAQHQAAMRKLAVVIDRASKALGEPTPAAAMKYLPTEDPQHR